MDELYYAALRKVLISWVVSAQLICTFVFTYAKSRFSHVLFVFYVLFGLMFYVHGKQLRSCGDSMYYAKILIIMKEGHTVDWSTG